ncbi:MAG: sulfatase-like hydrolase/transferase [Opitutales bacterium]
MLPPTETDLGRNGRPDILVLYVDQMRADALGCLGNGAAETPNLDNLAQQGRLHRNHYAGNPLCMPSRACFFTGLSTERHGVRTNGMSLDTSIPTLPGLLAAAGYRTGVTGKLHLSAQLDDKSPEGEEAFRSGDRDDWVGPLYGFDYARITTGHGEQTGGHYGRWRRTHYPDIPLGPDQAEARDRHPDLLCWRSRLPEEAHPSTWVANEAIRFLNETPADRPFFLFASFPDPHNPFTPPAAWADRFAGLEIDPPEDLGTELDNRPAIWRAMREGNAFQEDGNGTWCGDRPEALAACIRHTHAMNALIDKQVGRILTELEKIGRRKDTLIVFSSDHGDFLGDSGFLRKGPIPSRSLLHVPLIITDPSATPGVVDAASDNRALMPHLLRRAGLSVPNGREDADLPEPEDADPGEAYGSGWGKHNRAWNHLSLATRDWHLVLYPNLKDGELYCLREDPEERHNRFHDAAVRRKRKELEDRLAYLSRHAVEKPFTLATPW